MDEKETHFELLKIKIKLKDLLEQIECLLETLNSDYSIDEEVSDLLKLLNES